MSKRTHRWSWITTWSFTSPTDFQKRKARTFRLGLLKKRVVEGTFAPLYLIFELTCGFDTGFDFVAFELDVAANEVHDSARVGSKDDPAAFVTANA